MKNLDNEEQKRLDENAKKEVPLEKWGPYLSDRQWGTVREDYSKNGDAWNYFPHDHARSRAYRWGEDGLGGISDINQQLCFALALWNGKDPILKERLFGLSNPQGNHGEDVKELYYFLDNVPSHFYMKFLYKYPQNEFPYSDLVAKNKSRGKHDPEYEILDTGIFSNDEYFDVYIEYAKEDREDIFIKIEIVNRADKAASITVLPTLWFFNNWRNGEEQNKPSISFLNDHCVLAHHETLQDYYLYFPPTDSVLFTENNTNFEKLFHKPNKTKFVKDAFHDAIIGGKNLQKLKDKNGEINYLLVSFDSQRDGPAQLKKFAENSGLDKNWTLLHGSEDAVRTLSVLLNVQFEKDGEGNFSHSNIISVLDKDGVLVYQKEGLNAEHEQTVSTVSQLIQ